MLVAVVQKHVCSRTTGMQIQSRLCIQPAGGGGGWLAQGKES